MQKLILILGATVLFTSCKKSAEGVYISSKDNLDSLILSENYKVYRNKDGKKNFSKWGYQDKDIYIDDFINYGDMVGYEGDTFAVIFPCHYSLFTNKCYKIMINQDDGHSFRKVE